MRLDHISISVTPNDRPDKTSYKISAELKGIPGKPWQDGLRFVWYNSPFYLCKKSELVMEEDEVQLFLEDSSDLQKAIDTLSHCIQKANNTVKNTGVTYISSYRRAIN